MSEIYPEWVRFCKVCNQRLGYPRGRCRDDLCREHQFCEGNIWVLNCETYEWTRKFPLLQSAC